MEFAEVITRPRLDGVTFWRNNESQSRGSIVITGHHLIFQSNDDSKSHTSLVILHKSIDIVLVEPKSTPSVGGLLVLKCKDFSVFSIDCSTTYDDCLQVSKSIEILSNLTNVRLHYPYFHQCNFRIYENGWNAFNLNEDEFIRLQAQSDFWRISRVNKDFSVCLSYPEEVIVPKSVNDDILRASAQFREGGRFPVLCYYHKDTKAVIVRCSQPLVGNNNRRCREDEILLNSMLNSSNKGYIIDTRSQSFAQTAKTKGYGYEPEIYYPRWKRIHRATPRWPQLQESLVKLVEACNDGTISSEKWLSKLNSSGWLQNIADVLNCACVAAQCADREGEKSEMSVIVHGSEGTDSTLIVVSLIQVILDPDCRTIRGFEALVERDWVKGGHPFASRCAHLAYGRSKGNTVFDAPTFLLFLDCVWQIYNQFPCSFEFVDSFLLFLLDNAYSSEFGTFLCNNEKEKSENDVKEHTTSLWSYLNQPEVLRKYMNPFYEPNKGIMAEMYRRWTNNWDIVDLEWDHLVNLKAEEREIYSKVLQLQRLKFMASLSNNRSDPEIFSSDGNTSPASQEQITTRVGLLVQDNRLLKVEIDVLETRIKSLQIENRALKANSIQMQVKAEQEEEFISNTLLKKIQELKKEKETLALNYEQEEECLSNDLSKKLIKLKKEKEALRSNLHQEQSYLITKLTNRIKKLEAETNSKQLHLDQLRREKVELENTLEQEQESLVNRLWKRLDHLETEKQVLQRKLDQPISTPPSPMEANIDYFNSPVDVESQQPSKQLKLARDIIRLRGEVLQLKQQLRINQTEHSEKMSQYAREEQQIRDENEHLQNLLQLEIEKSSKLLQNVPETSFGVDFKIDDIACVSSEFPPPRPLSRIRDRSPITNCSLSSKNRLLSTPSPTGSPFSVLRDGGSSSCGEILDEHEHGRCSSCGYRIGRRTLETAAATSSDCEITNYNNHSNP